MNLYLDTSNNYYILCLFDQETIIEKVITTKQNQSEIFFKELDLFLMENNFTLDLVNHFLFTRGPGSFTGVRIGLTFSKVLTYKYPGKVFSIPSIYTLIDIDNTNKCCATIDARSKKVYTCCFELNQFSPITLVAAFSSDFEYDKVINNICSNVRKLYYKNYFKSDLNAEYIKEAF